MSESTSRRRGRDRNERVDVTVERETTPFTLDRVTATVWRRPAWWSGWTLAGVGWHDAGDPPRASLEDRTLTAIGHAYLDAQERADREAERQRAQVVAEETLRRFLAG